MDGFKKVDGLISSLTEDRIKTWPDDPEYPEADKTPMESDDMVSSVDKLIREAESPTPRDSRDFEAVQTSGEGLGELEKLRIYVDAPAGKQQELAVALLDAILTGKSEKVFADSVPELKSFDYDWNAVWKMVLKAPTERIDRFVEELKTIATVMLTGKKPARAEGTANTDLSDSILDALKSSMSVTTFAMTPPKVLGRNLIDFSRYAYDWDQVLRIAKKHATESSEIRSYIYEVKRIAQGFLRGKQSIPTGVSSRQKEGAERRIAQMIAELLSYGRRPNEVRAYVKKDLEAHKESPETWVHQWERVRQFAKEYAKGFGVSKKLVDTVIDGMPYADPHYMGQPEDKYQRFEPRNVPAYFATADYEIIRKDDGFFIKDDAYNLIIGPFADYEDAKKWGLERSKPMKEDEESFFEDMGESRSPEERRVFQLARGLRRSGVEIELTLASLGKDHAAVETVRSLLSSVRSHIEILKVLGKKEAVVEAKKILSAVEDLVWKHGRPPQAAPRTAPSDSTSAPALSSPVADEARKKKPLGRLEGLLKTLSESAEV